MDKEEIRRLIMEAGASAVGFARAEEVSAEALSRFGRWLARGAAGELGYMHNYPELRRDPRLLLDGCLTVVSTAWAYNPSVLRSPSLPYLARYAYCRDYHNALRSALKPVARRIEEAIGAAWRICIDSAPVMERYWAVKAGVGFCGRSGLLIVPGTGSRVFLAELLLSVPLEPDAPCTLSCGDCGACVRACPAHALDDGPAPDCRRCISALTIERPGSAARLPRPTLAGCDVCQDVCPHNAGAPAGRVTQLATLPQLLEVDEAEIQRLTPEEFRKRYAGTPLMRIGLEGLRANLAVPRS